MGLVILIALLFACYDIEAKTGIEDWHGIRSFVLQKSSRSKRKDPALDAHLSAITNLIKLAKQRDDKKLEGEYAFEAIQRIADKISGEALKPEYFAQLIEIQNTFVVKFLTTLKAQNKSDGDQLNIASSSIKIMSLGVLTYGVVETTCSSLDIWFSDVENRPVVDYHALEILIDNINKLTRIESLLNKRPNSERCQTLVSETIRDLECRGGKFRSEG